MDFVTTLVYAFIAALVVGCVTFGIALRMGRYDVVDAAWGWMFIVPVWAAVGIHNMKPSALQVAIIVTAWGMR
jgi:steroid 5-alpha reductase family enzyme